MKCKNCGVTIDDETGYCPECGTENKKNPENLKEDFNVLYDIDGFDVFEEDKFEANMKRKRRLICICIAAVVVLVAFIGISWAKNKSVVYDENKIVQNNTEYVKTDESEKLNTEEVMDDKTPETDVEDIEENEPANEELRERIKKFCNRYNNSVTPYEGELIAVVKNGTTVSATYLIPKSISIEERDRIKELEEELKNMIIDEIDEKFAEEITVNVNIKVSYRQ